MKRLGEWIEHRLDNPKYCVGLHEWIEIEHKQIEMCDVCGKWREMKEKRPPSRLAKLGSAVLDWMFGEKKGGAR